MQVKDMLTHQVFNMILRILASYEAKTAKIFNFWTFWHVIQLMNHLIKNPQETVCPTLYGPLVKKVFLSDFEKMVY